MYWHCCHCMGRFVSVRLSGGQRYGDSLRKHTLRRGVPGQSFRGVPAVLRPGLLQRLPPLRPRVGARRDAMVSLRLCLLIVLFLPATSTYMYIHDHICLGNACLFSIVIFRFFLQVSLCCKEAVDIPSLPLSRYGRLQVDYLTPFLKQQYWKGRWRFQHETQPSVPHCIFLRGAIVNRTKYC